MSLQLRVKYQFRNLAHFFWSLTLPAWLTGYRAKVTAMSLIVLLSVGYVVEVNRMSTGGYVVNDLEKQIESISADTQKLSVQVADYQSMNSLQRRIKSGEMVAVTNVHYFSPVVETALSKR